MVGKVSKKTLFKVCALIAVIVMVIALLVGNIFSANSNKYVLIVKKEIAESQDDNLKITESIVKGAGQQSFDSKSFDYEVKVENVAEKNNTETQVAIVLDTSYSMSVNDVNTVVRSTAKELAVDILNGVDKSKVSISNNRSTPVPMTNGNLQQSVNAINTAFANNLITGDGSDSNVGLNNAVASFSATTSAVNKYIIVLTDATDEVSAKMQKIKTDNPEIKVISILVDMTSNSYILDDGSGNVSPLNGDVFVLLSENTASSITNVAQNRIIDPNNRGTDGKISDLKKIYNEMNKSVRDIKVSNKFSDEILKYFDITYNTAGSNGTVTLTQDENGKNNGYEWTVGTLNKGQSSTLKFNLQARIKDINKDILFHEINTNKQQDVEYKAGESENIVSLKGTDAREDTESTIIKVVRGYDIKIQAVNQTDTNSGIEGIGFIVIGTKVNDDGTQEVIYTSDELKTDQNGYVTITADEASALREEGRISYEVRPVVNKAGYSQTNSVYFDIINDKNTGSLSKDNRGNNDLDLNLDEPNRLVTVKVPIEGEKFDFEVKVHELNNTNVTISGSKFQLIQPKLNSSSELSVLEGETNADGTIHFSPTVIVKDDTYDYMLRQVDAPDGYENAHVAVIKVEFENGKVKSVKSDKKYNEDVIAELCTDKENHVLVTVPNKNNKENPFKLQINVEDKVDGTKLNDVTYIVTTISSNGQERKEVVKTVNGQINTDIYGSGLLKINITEQLPAVGYKQDALTKEIVINRVNDVIDIMNQNNLVRTDPATVSNKIDNVGTNNDSDGLIVNLYKEKKKEQNILKLKLVEADEQDVSVGSGVVYTLTDPNGVRSPRVVSNTQGELVFTLATMPQGVHEYILSVDPNTIPNQYDDTRILKDIRVRIGFDAQGCILEGVNGLSVIDNTNVLNEEASMQVNQQSIEYTAFIKLGYPLNQSSTVKFLVQLADDETKAPIEGAKYSLDIKWNVTVDGQIVERTKKIDGRFTNSNGQISTRIARADEVTVTVTEIEAKPGYNRDLTVQEILINSNGPVRIIAQSGYGQDDHLDASGQGGYINNGAVVFKHFNRKRSSEDTYLNLTLNVVDREYSPTMGFTYLSGVWLKITSDTLLDENGAPLQLIMRTGDQGSDGEVTVDYEKYINKENGYTHTIRVPGIGVDTERAVYKMRICQLELDQNGNFKEKIETVSTYNMAYTYKNGRVSLNQLECDYGNRLIANTPGTQDGKYFSNYADDDQGTQKEDTMGVFLGNVNLRLYTNYDDIGNLSLDFKKQNEKEELLKGAQYALRVTNPDGTIIRKNIVIANGDDDIELSGLNVSVGSIIELEEKVAPIGYTINDTEMFRVSQIDTEGEVTLEHINDTYNPTRVKLKSKTEMTASGLKTFYEIIFIDHSLDTFEFEITTKDVDTQAGVSGYGFTIDTNKGSRGRLLTGSNGTGNTKVGGSVESNTIEYTITSYATADYYKPLTTPIKVIVPFDVNGRIDISRLTNSADPDYVQQTDSGYGTLWSITKIEDTADGKIGITINVEHQDPLVVNVQTKDRITNATVSNVQYKVEPTQILQAIGSDRIEVGFITQNATKTYKLTQTNIQPSYATSASEEFTVTYINGKITQAVLNNNSTTSVISNNGDKEVTITIYVEPKVPFEITNSYFFEHNTKLQGANFEVISQRNQDKASGTTDANGKMGIYSDVFGTSDNEKVLYKVRQTKAADGYATVEDFYVQVTYNANREIISAKLTDQHGVDVTNNRYITVGFTKTSTYSQYNSNNKGIVTIDVLNYPEFKILIKDVDRRDRTTPIAGTTYSVTSTYDDQFGNKVDFTKTEGVVTQADGVGIAHLDRTRDDTIVIYTVKESAPATNWQSLGKDIKIKVTFDGNGFVSNAELVDDDVKNIADVNKVDPIVVDSDRFTVNLQLQNNPILKFNITKVDAKDHDVKINDVAFTIVGKDENGDIYTNSSATNRVNQSGNAQMSTLTGRVPGKGDGYTVMYLDRTLENKKMKYTIHETVKAPAYNWLSDDIILDITYDENGKISQSGAPSSESAQVKVTGYDVDNFTVDLEVYNSEIDEFNIHLTATDAYNSDKKLKDIQVDAYLTNGNYDPDNKYSLMGNDGLLTGADRNNDGIPDNNTQGEDHRIFGAYTEGAGTRTLRLKITNDTYKPAGANTNKEAYYLDKNRKNIGYYIGNQYYEDAKYQVWSYECLIDVQFDDNGKILDATLRNGGLDGIIGWLVDNRYVQVETGTNNKIKHTDYGLDIRLKFFPMLDLNVFAMDNYTYQSEKDKDGVPVKLDGSKYLISTSRHYPNGYVDEYVTTGYIGYGHDIGPSQKAYGDIYEGIDRILLPIETPSELNKGERLLYIYEKSEPTNYQKMRPWNYQDVYQELVAIVKVKFDEHGEIDYDNSIVRKVNATTTYKPWQNEAGNNYLSNSNIKEYNYWYQGNDGNKRVSSQQIDFYIGYALTTKINVTAVDDISGDPISNIRMYPFINTEVKQEYNNYGMCLTNSSYNYNVDNYRDTDGNGQFNIKYWGASKANEVHQYIIGSSRQGNAYNGYLFPSDMASMASQIVGQTGNAKDYYAKLDIQYDDKGRISSVKTLGKDLWGDDNVDADITWDSTTGNVNIKMLYSRKFQMALYKKDLYDSNIDKLAARFSISWRDPETNGESKIYINSITANDMKAEYLTPLGKVYKGKKVKYTLSEEVVPVGYNQIPGTIDFWVEFDNSGNIGMNSVELDKDSVPLYQRYFEVAGTSTTTKESNKRKPDLTINLKNEPAFMLNLRVIDEFYKADGISDIQLEITNDKDKDVCVNAVTNSNGWADGLKVGKVYPNETVTYTIKQKNFKDPDYYRNDTVVKLKVTFDERGRIKAHYEIINGKEVINNFNLTKFENGRYVSMEIMNRPRALKIGLKKYDQLNSQLLGDVRFTVTKSIIQSDGSETQVNTVELNATDPTTGTIVQQIDEFMSRDSAKAQTVKYTIHEVNVPPTYRKMQDAVIIVEYTNEGKINSFRRAQNNVGVINQDVTMSAAINTIHHLNTVAGNERVHLLVNAPNDNAYDIIIKNEDTNYNGLGIEGSQFAVSINGQQYNPALTNTQGITTLKNLTQSGKIEINISQKAVGDGYRFDQNNVALIKVEKGTQEYSLKLDPTMVGRQDDANAILPKAVVKVDEEYGTITVTFKNETKVELTLIKQDVDTKKVLEGAGFQVIAQEIDTNGNLVGDPEFIQSPNNNLVTNSNNESYYVTDSNGQIYFDIGIAPSGNGTKIWKYTIVEKQQPVNPETSQTYNPIIALELTVTYDQYGKIINMTSNSRARMVPIKEHSNNVNCRSMKAIIYNGDITPAYKFTIYTVDAETGRKINGSQVHTEITEDNGNFIKVEPKTSASSSNGQTAETKNLGVNGVMYTDAELDALKAANKPVPAVQDLGLIYIDNIDYEGILNINVDQLKTAPGYTLGDQKTSTGKIPIKIKATYEPHLGKDPTVKFEVINDSGFGEQLIVDNLNREIILTIKNESQVTFDILTLQYGSEKPINPATNYTISAEIQTLSSSTPINPLEGTQDFVTTPLTDEKGKTSRTAGSAQAGKTVVYTIHQNTPLQYKQIEDIKIEVRYDSRGYIIQYPEMLTSEDNAYIKEEETGGRKISLVVQNKKDIKGYKVNIEKHAQDTDDDLYAYNKTLPGAVFKIKVEEQQGDGDEWTGITDQNGLIKGPALIGTGKIKITAIEQKAPEGYTTPVGENAKYWFEGYRDPATGEFDDNRSSNVNMEDIDSTKLDKDGNLILTLRPLNKQASDRFTVILNKRSNATNKNITESQAKFKLELYSKKDAQNGNQYSYYDILEVEAPTDQRGKLILDKLKMPDKPGEYILAITETEAPQGYKKLSEKLEIPVTFVQNADGEIVIDSVNTDGNGLEHVEPSKVDKQLIGLFIGNDVDDELKEDEYRLDITKVDAETGDPIENMALFKVWLPDSQNTAVYTETDKSPLGIGKLDYLYIQEAKDYLVRLTHMEKPTQPITLQYKFSETLPPDGYSKIEDELILTIKFDYDDNGKIVIVDATSSNENYLKIRKDVTPLPTENLKVDILNNVANKNEFTVHYDANDNGAGTKVPADQTKYKGQALVLSTDEPTRDGFFFEGWATDPKATQPEYQPGDTFNIDADTTLYAIWEEKLWLKSDEYQIVNAELQVTGVPSIGRKKVVYDTDKVWEYNDGDRFITGILPQVSTPALREDQKGTKVEEFISNLKHNADSVKVYKKVWNANKTGVIEEEAKLTDLVVTAMKVELKKGTKQTISLELAVVGDVYSNTMNMTNGNGEEIIISGDGVLKQNDQSYVMTQSNYFAPILNRSGMVFVVALDLDLDGRINQSNVSVYLENVPKKSKSVLKSLLPWNKNKN